MSNVIECRSYLEIAEDLLLDATKQVFNVSRFEAAKHRIQRRELGAAERQQAEALVAVWAGTPEQMDTAHWISMRKQYAVSHSM